MVLAFQIDVVTASKLAKMTNVKAASNINLLTETILRRADNEKKRAYNQRVIEIEHGTFTPLVFGTNGAMRRECQLFHKKLAKKLSQKQNKKYHEVITDIRTKISFNFIKSMLSCLRGSRTVF